MVTGIDPAGPVTVVTAQWHGTQAVTLVYRDHATVHLDGSRPVKRFGDISKEVLDHFASQVDTDLEVTIEVVARKPDGFADSIVRTITENARTLKFDEDSGFAED
jgi:hypothetical protein